MKTITLYISNGEQPEAPEGDICWTPLVDYDPRNRNSLERAREAVRIHFSLGYLPVLCSEPEPSWLGAMLEAAKRRFARKAT